MARLDFDECARAGALARAINAGVPVRGYFVWSLLDNFVPDARRIPKTSFAAYRSLIERARHDTAFSSATAG